jgi:hypothetical protein
MASAFLPQTRHFRIALRVFNFIWTTFLPVTLTRGGEGCLLSTPRMRGNRGVGGPGQCRAWLRCYSFAEEQSGHLVFKIAAARLIARYDKISRAATLHAVALEVNASLLAG